ncbi:Mu transposase/integrase [Xenococcus sp. PCC 7305]|uniref:Mu transposase C-terminal domain-containing protein n=1 Tax=Xenococcus sp. PCC 7305 TaxID=102125 RepID=UPI0002AC599B|nr:Mu transposase C-terminal domain-containing protein [Xenococcus sp. PCC 7305]ELS02928.1 Mu transposase/integrase [Xenococcus sp. PCC 7305]
MNNNKTLELISKELASNSDTKQENIIASELEGIAKIRLEVIQSLLEPCDRVTYGERLRAGAQKLGISVRSVQRLFKKYQEQGITALVSTSRADKGNHRISQFWQDFILKTYKQGNKGSKRMSPKQVALRVQAKAIEVREDKPPSYKTVLRVLKSIRDKKKKSIRSPGWQGTTLSVKTRDGQDIDINHSNQVWQCDHTLADILLIDRHGELIGRPWLTTVIDSYSRCVMGVNLGFDAPSSQVVALALRHAILPKKYGVEYQLHCDWGTFGLPEYLFTDGGKDFRSSHLEEIASQLGFVRKLRDRPSEGGIVERPFKTLNQSLFLTLPGYTGSNVQERPKDAEKDASLTLRDLEKLVACFIVDQYNQSAIAGKDEQTRYQRWEAGLIKDPRIISERELDICLMKTARRTVQRAGHLQFENIVYRGEYLAGYAGDIVSVRYDPQDITTIWVYRQEGSQEVFLTRAYALGLETEQLSLDEAKANVKRLRKAKADINNESIFQEIVKRDSVVDKKKTRKQRQKEEQRYKSTPSQKVIPEDIEVQEAKQDISDEIADVEVWDLEELQDEYGW